MHKETSRTSAITPCSSNAGILSPAPKWLNHPHMEWNTVSTPNIGPLQTLDRDLRPQQIAPPDAVNMFKRPNVWCCYVSAQEISAILVFLAGTAHTHCHSRELTTSKNTCTGRHEELPSKIDCARGEACAASESAVCPPTPPVVQKLSIRRPSPRNSEKNASNTQVLFHRPVYSGNLWRYHPLWHRNRFGLCMQMCSQVRGQRRQIVHMRIDLPRDVTKEITQVLSVHVKRRQRGGMECTEVHTCLSKSSWQGTIGTTVSQPWSPTFITLTTR